MSWGDFTTRMREAAPTGWLTLIELCVQAGVDSSVLFYNSIFGDAMAKMYELGILREEKRNVEDEDGWTLIEEYVRVAHPNLWEEVVGNLKHAEARCRMHKPAATEVTQIDSYQQFVKVFGLSSASGTIELDKSAQSG